MKRKAWTLAPAMAAVIMLQSYSQEAGEKPVEKAAEGAAQAAADAAKKAADAAVTPAVDDAKKMKEELGKKAEMPAEVPKPAVPVPLPAAANENQPKPADAVPMPELIPLPGVDGRGQPLPPTIAPVPGLPDIAQLGQVPQNRSSALDQPFTRSLDLLPVSLTGVSLFADTRKSASEPARQWEAGAKQQLSAGVQIVGGLSTPDPSGLRSQLQPFIQRNKPASFRDVQDMVDIIQKHYRKHNRPMTHVYIPRQSMYSDKVVISVLEGRVGEIMILTEADLRKKDAAQLTSAEKSFLARMSDEKNFWNSWYNNPYRAADVAEEFLPRTKPLQGRIVDMEEIKAQVTGMNRSPWVRLNRPATHPFRDVNVLFAQPDANILGTTNLILEVDDRRPLRFFAGVDNGLTESTGENRLFLGASWYDAFLLGKNHQMGAQLFSALDPNDLMGISLSYQIPWQQFKYDQFSEFFLSYADSSTTVTLGGIPGVEIGGSSLIFGGRHYLELPEMFGATDMTEPLGSRNKNLWAQKTREAMGLHHEVALGFDFKMADNNLEFGGSTVAESPADIFQVVLEYNARQTDPTGESNLAAQLFLSPGSVTADNDDDAFAPLRRDAEATYVYTRMRLEREQDLPFSGHFHGMMAKGALTAQYASTNLMASEQLGLGGYGSVRGYPERILRGDIGAIVNLELYSPDYHPTRNWFKGKKDDTLNVLAFFDYAHGSSSSESVSDPLDDAANLMSVGLGLRYEYDDMLKLRFDYGIRLEDLPDAADDTESGAFHFGAFCTF